ncbi:hypothetical protein L916_08743 [Phytophthora nicotianae]|uniref:Uncharacterized protein n=1 Tax=Phytophthora nicotianae TaxID=4792 RepID=W2J2W8_PHYNI|nr:hypothetical protein L916_08743 [Phytophthora nicotianae]
MARTKTVQRSSSVTRALSDTLSQQPKETETQLAEQPEANEPATASTKTPVTNLPETENAFLAETIKTPASESPVEQRNERRRTVSGACGNYHGNADNVGSNDDNYFGDDFDSYPTHASHSGRIDGVEGWRPRLSWNVEPAGGTCIDAAR